MYKPVKEKKIERRDEFVKVAQKMFFEIGYDNTTVNAIVDELNVGKGTFYYHFDSKDDILVAVLEKFGAVMETRLSEIFKSSQLPVKQRMRAALKAIFDHFNDNIGMWYYVYHENNIMLHDRLLKMSCERFTPPLADIISEGVEKNKFNTLYPSETALSILVLFDLFAKQYFETGGSLTLEKMQAVLENIIGHILENRPLSFAAG